jgi:hypothetical protein
VALVVIKDKALDGLKVSLFSTDAIMFQSQAMFHLLKQGWLGRYDIGHIGAPQ